MALKKLGTDQLQGYEEFVQKIRTQHIREIYLYVFLLFYGVIFLTCTGVFLADVFSLLPRPLAKHWVDLVDSVLGTQGFLVASLIAIRWLFNRQ